MQKSGPSNRRSLLMMDLRLLHLCFKVFNILFPIEDEVKKADLARSLFRLGCQNLGQMAIIHALAFGVRRVYFTGSFVSIPLARKFITAEIEGRNNMKPKKSLIPSHYIFAAGQRSYWKVMFSAVCVCLSVSLSVYGGGVLCDHYPSCIGPHSTAPSFCKVPGLSPLCTGPQHQTVMYKLTLCTMPQLTCAGPHIWPSPC